MKYLQNTNKEWKEKEMEQYYARSTIKKRGSFAASVIRFFEYKKQGSVCCDTCC
jgi:hypothetical protein